jgi:hypothetical protein
VFLGVSLDKSLPEPLEDFSYDRALDAFFGLSASCFLLVVFGDLDRFGNFTSSSSSLFNCFLDFGLGSSFLKDVTLLVMVLSVGCVKE